MNDDLPEGWKWSTIGEVADVQLGRQRSPAHHNGDQMRPYLRSANVTWDGISVEDVNEMNFDDADFEKYSLEPGDLLLNEASGSPNEVGKPAIWSGEILNCCFQNTLLRLRPHEVDRSYLYWYCYFAALTGRFGEASRGVNIRHLGKRGLASFRIPIAPPDEQQRIVSAIEEHLTRLRVAVESVERCARNVDQLRPRVLGEILGVAAAPSLDDAAPVVALPNGWKWERAAAVCEMVASGSTPKAAKMASGSGDVPFIKVYNLGFEGDLDFTLKPTFVGRDTHEGFLRRSRLRPGDVLINIVGPPLGKVAMVPSDHPEWNMNQAVAAFRPGREMSGAFLAFLLQSSVVLDPLLRTGKATAGQRNLSITNCRRIWLPVPPIEEQGVLTERLEEAASVVGATRHGVRIGLHRGETMRRSILSAAFEGGLTSGVAAA
ncbi:MAG: hypothetical protein GY798_18715 [Hyphomicrobiales bacterium]|nr:hypothetical protein [Hyphomicrobiales bacterium]